MLSLYTYMISQISQSVSELMEEVVCYQVAVIGIKLTSILNMDVQESVILRLEVNKCAFTFSSEIRQSNARALNFDASNARGPQGRVHWTRLKFRQVHWVFLFHEQK